MDLKVSHMPFFADLKSYSLQGDPIHKIRPVPELSLFT